MKVELETINEDQIDFHYVLTLGEIKYILTPCAFEKLKTTILEEKAIS